MNPSRPANLRPRIPRSPLAEGRARTALVVLLAAACRAPLGGRELDLSLSAQTLPGAGAGVSVAQRMLTRGARRIDFELGLERQELSESGPGGDDDWTRLFAGLRCAASAPRAHLQGRAGVTWLRSEGESHALSDPGDYGGAYFGTGWSFELAPALATGPDLTLLWVDSEGDRSGSAAVVELAWRWVWHL